MTARSRAAAALGASALLLAGLAAGCIERGYPLGTSGSVEVRLDVASSLYAADVVDDTGKGALPRQVPYSTGVTLTMVEGTEAANGGFVDVHVEPAEALTLTPDPNEDPPEGSTSTCKAKEGKFRCTATPEGIARFVLTSEADWSGDATLVVTWADQRKETPVEVLPAGLPPDAKNFAIVASDLSDTDHILPTYTALACTTLDTSMEDLGSKWRAGAIRHREAFVRASAPSTEPGVVANAPVVIESLSSELALSENEACGDADRVTRLRVVLGETGESPPFYLCFSDLGGDAELSVTSGILSLSPNPAVHIDPEPRVLRVTALSTSAIAGIPAELFEVAAFNTNLEPVAMPVDLESSDPEVMLLSQASETLAGEGLPPTSVVVLPLVEGTAELHVRPRLFDSPDCASIEITVTVAP